MRGGVSACGVPPVGRVVVCALWCLFCIACNRILGIEPPVASTCEDAGCAPVADKRSRCIEGGMRCVARTLERCSAQGSYQVERTCPYVCESGSCVGRCAPQQERCFGAQYQRCDSHGVWYTEDGCSARCGGSDCESQVWLGSARRVRGTEGRPGDRFGQGLALSGSDGLIAAPGAGAGVVHHIEVEAGRWSTTDEVISGADLGVWAFGRRVAIGERWVVVGAQLGAQAPSPDVSASATSDGAVFAYLRAGDAGTAPQQLVPKTHPAGPGWGYALALAGNWLAISRVPNWVDPLQDAEGAGSVDVFTQLAGRWEWRGELTADRETAGDAFGYSIAMDGEWLAVGAPGDDSGATAVNGARDGAPAVDSGAVYMFRRLNERFELVAYIKAHNTDRHDHFGHSVALQGELLIVGAPLEDSVARGVHSEGDNNDSRDSGATYVYQRDDDGWRIHAYLKQDNAGSGYRFGSAVATSGGRIAVGAPQRGSDEGGAYLFVPHGSAFRQSAFVEAATRRPRASFGGALELSAGWLLVGASGASGEVSEDGTSAGAAYAFPILTP